VGAVEGARVSSSLVGGAVVLEKLEQVGQGGRRQKRMGRRLQCLGAVSPKQTL